MQGWLALGVLQAQSRAQGCCCWCCQLLLLSGRRQWKGLVVAAAPGVVGVGV